MELPQSIILKSKTHILLLAIVLLILNNGLAGFLPQTSVSQQVSAVLFAIAFNVLTVFWCIYDSRERGEVPGRYFTFSVIIFGTLALFYYLFKTRGFKLGLVAIGKFMALFLGTIAISSIIFAVLDSIFESSLK